MTLKEITEKRNKLVADARAIYDRAENEQRDLSSEEQTHFDGMMNEVEQLRTRADRLEQLTSAEQEQQNSRGRRTVPETRSAGNDEALRSWLLGNGGKEFGFDLRTKALRSGEDVRAWQTRAQGTTTGAAGGYTVSDEFLGELEVALLAFGGVRNVARVLRTTTGAPLPMGTLNDTGVEGRILGEGAAAVTQDMTFGQKSLGAFKYTSDVVMVPRELLEDTAIDLASEIGGALGDRIARITNRHFTVGLGDGSQPQGIVTGAPVAFTAASATTVTYDELIDLEHSVDSSYRTDAQFLISDSALRQIKKIKDADGRPIWVPGLASGAPDTILGYKYALNPHMDVMGANATPILFGATKKFAIRDVRDVRLYRLEERWAETDSVGFLAFYRGDSRLIDAGTNPVKTLKMAAA
jgi:HK97 family phage major capsid protein